MVFYMIHLLDWPRLAAAMEHDIHRCSTGVKERRVMVPGIGLELWKRKGRQRR